MVRRLIRPAETEFQRMLGRQERHHVRTRRLRAQIGDQMAQVVLLLRADRVVGDHDADLLPRQRSDGVVGIDPCVHPLG